MDAYAYIYVGNIYMHIYIYILLRIKHLDWFHLTWLNMELKTSTDNASPLRHMRTWLNPAITDSLCILKQVHEINTKKNNMTDRSKGVFWCVFDKVKKLGEATNKIYVNNMSQLWRSWPSNHHPEYWWACCHDNRTASKARMSHRERRMWRLVCVREYVYAREVAG